MGGEAPKRVSAETSWDPQKPKNPLQERASRKRLIGLEPTTFCWQAVPQFRLFGRNAGFRLRRMRLDCVRLPSVWTRIWRICSAHETGLEDAVLRQHEQ